MRISFSFTLEEMPRWWYRLFPCRHEMVSIKTNPFDRYGARESWIECKKCGRDISHAQDNCKHEPNGFGVCWLCNERVAKFDCEHEKLTKEEAMGYEWCENCGEEFFYET